MLLPLVELMCVPARSRVSKLMPDVSGRRPIKSLPCWHSWHTFAQNWSSIAAFSSPKSYTDIAESVSTRENIGRRSLASETQALLHEYPPADR